MIPLENSLAISKTLNINLSEILLLRIYSRAMETFLYTMTWTQGFTTALFIIGEE